MQIIEDKAAKNKFLKRGNTAEECSADPIVVVTQPAKKGNIFSIICFLLKFIFS
jgi:hypothetical protein